MPDTHSRTPRQRLDRISEEGLCIGCGLCQSLAGTDSVRMTVTPDGLERPAVVGPLTHETVDRIYDTCPSTRVDGLPEREITPETVIDPVWGPLLAIKDGHATDPDIRYLGSTGGVLTALGIYLLESGRVDYILHARASDTNPSFGMRHISRSRQDVIDGAGSRYGPTATLIDLKEQVDKGERFAFIGTPCDVSGFRNAARHDRRIDEQCRYILTLVCGGFMQTPALKGALKGMDVDFDRIVSMRYRGFGCPGPTVMTMRDGTVEKRTYQDFWGGGESTWGLPLRCKICPDSIGEAADIAASDIWPNGGPDPETQGRDPGSNGILVRTARGRELLEAAMRDGAISIAREIAVREMDGFQPHQVVKKKAAWARHAGLRSAGRLAPETERLRIADLAAGNGVAANLREAHGIKQRTRDGRHDEATPRE